MSASALVTFNADAKAVESYNARMKTTTVRLLTAKEFKTQKGLKGNEASRAYNAYLREQGQANTAGLAAALTSGELLVRGVQDSQKSLRVSFMKRSQIRDPKAKSDSPALSDLTVEQLEARLAELKAKAQTVARA